ncbi:MAG: DNA polymerase III subunit [Candidatus Omnitrophica bacterium]|nr:DNA polymerase III subunit [Candidatus Omnitrophota bacterium]
MNLKESREFLVKTKKQGKIAGAYIICGGNKNQRDETAVFLSMLLNCRQSSPCFECEACIKIKKRIYPDVKWVVPSKSILSIDDVRNVKEEIYITPYSGEKKVYIFNVEYMKDEAANAFLKILEEPPAHGVLVIASSNISFFLPTIVSRCQKIRLNYILPEHGEEMASAGEQFSEILTQARSGNFFGMFKSIDALVKGKEREEVEEWLGRVVLIYRDAYFKRKDIAPELLIDADSETDGLFRNESGFEDVIEKILELKGRVRYNINVKLGLDNLFLHIAHM